MEAELLEYSEPLDLMGVVTELQVADISDEERVQVLQRWCSEVGRIYEDWMGRVVVGPPVGFGQEEGEVLTVG